MNKNPPISWKEGIALLVVGFLCALASLLLSLSLTPLFLNQEFLWNLIQIAGVIAGFGFVSFQLQPKRKIEFFHIEFKKDLSTVATFGVISIFLALAAMPFLIYNSGPLYVALLILTWMALLSFLYALVILLVSIIYYSRRLSP